LVLGVASKSSRLEFEDSTVRNSGIGDPTAYESYDILKVSAGQTLVDATIRRLLGLLSQAG